MVETIKRLMRISEQLVQKCGREPTTAEIAEGMGVPPERVCEIRMVSQEPVSLEVLREEASAYLEEFLEDPDPTPPEAATVRLLREQVGDLLGTLSERERRVLQLRFGLEDGRSRTLEDEWGATSASRASASGRSRRQALRKLRHTR